MTTLYSFDVFDTLVTRTTATPDGIFAIVQEELQNIRPEIAHKFPRGFYQTRIDSEKYARLFYIKDMIEEITFAQIYDVMQTMVCISAEERNMLMDIEFQTEINNSVPININIDRIKNLLKRKKRIVLISDMYLSSKQIRIILCKHCNIFNDIPIYVSSEHSVVKSSGKLFQIVRRNELVEKQKWVHSGDNKVADVSAPKRLGLRIRRSRFPGLLKVEKKLLTDHGHDAKYQLFVGAAKNIRLTGDNSVQREFGSAYGAAILLQYVLWVIYQCRICEIRYLYFVARDGFILKKIFDFINSQKRLGISSKYLYGSRKAWKVSDFIVNDMDSDSYTKSYEDRNLIEGYLKQEIDGTVTRIGFVDVRGVSGNSQESLSNFVRNFSKAEIHSFYMILDRDMRSRFYYHRMLPDFSDKNGIVEMLTRATHGKTAGYCKRENKIEPILIRDESEALLEYGYEKYIQAVIETIHTYYDYIRINNYDLEIFNMGEEYLSYLMEKENGRMFSFLCNIPVMTEIKGHEKLQTFAPRYSKYEIENVRKFGYMDERGWCPSFSLRRCTNEERETIRKNKQIFALGKESVVKRGYYVVTPDKLCSSIALYGIGNVGKNLYEYITSNKLAKIIVWTDKKIENKDGIFDSIYNLKEYAFDQIVIAIKDRMTVFDVKTDLLIEGFHESMLYWEDYNYYYEGSN